MISVIIADDHALVSDGIQSLLERMGDVEVIGQATDGQMAIDLVLKLKPDVLLIDLSMPRLNGIEAIQRLVAAGSPTRVVVVSMHKEEVIVLRALRAGAKGYLLKDSFKEELFLAIHSAARGELYLSPRVASQVLEILAAKPTGNPLSEPLEKLSTREREVLQLILEGQTNREMAQTLRISIKTVDKHRTNLMKKLHVHDVAGLMHVALKSEMLYVR